MIRFSRPGYPEKDSVAFLQNCLREQIESGIMTNNGPCVQELERELANYLQVDHVIAVCNATVGLEVVAKALELKGEIIVPSYTFAATVQAMRWVGLKPVFCDVISTRQHTISPLKAAKLINSRTSAILGVHLWGDPCQTDALESLGLPVFYDAAHAFGCWHQGKQIGHFGRAEVFSFHATKYVHGAEGGIITTNDAELANRIRRMICFGGFHGEVIDQGTNAKMSEIHAVLVFESLLYERRLQEQNERNYRLYCDYPFKNGLAVHRISEDGRRNFQYVVMVAKDREHRDRTMKACLVTGIETRPYFPALHRTINGRRSRMEWTEQLADTTFCVPNGHLTEDEVLTVCKTMDILE